MDATREVSEAKAEKLVEKFDKQLKENWGLETLVTVGESWLPAMVDQVCVVGGRRKGRKEEVQWGGRGGEARPFQRA